jgi:adenylosuccinate synthase
MPELRECGKEFGTVTGRPRKCTWNDLQQIDYAISIVQPNEIVVTKLDILEGMKEIYVYDGPNTPICVGTLDNYKEFLLKRFPQIKWFSESPDGDMALVR